LPKFSSIGFGGTFDRLHSGHTLMMDLASFYGNEIQIGLIGDNYLKKHKKILGDKIFPYSKRAKNVIEYFSEREKTCTIIKIDSMGKDKEYAIESELNAILVSPETFGGAFSINRKRKSLHKRTMTIVIVPFAISKNGSKISSSILRKENHKIL
jgi:pantetheine-phosphate adenylyltransferase